MVQRGYVRDYGAAEVQGFIERLKFGDYFTHGLSFILRRFNCLLSDTLVKVFCRALDLVTLLIAKAVITLSNHGVFDAKALNLSDCLVTALHR